MAGNTAPFESHPELAWTETSPGHYTRSLGEIEKFFVLMGAAGHPIDRDCASLSGMVTVTYRPKIKRSDPSKDPPSSWDIVRAARHAWMQLRADLTAQAVELNPEEQTLSYDAITSQADLEEWADRTFILGFPPLTPEDVAAASKPTIGPAVMTFFPDPSSDTHRLIFHTTHWRFDAQGSLQLVERYLDLLTEVNLDDTTIPIPSQKEQAERLTPPFEAVCGVPTMFSDETTKKIEEEFAHCRRNFPSLGMPIPDAQYPFMPASARATKITLSKEMTKRVFAACKANKVTLTGAFNAAMVMALQELAPREHKGRSYAFASPVSLRAAVPWPYFTSAHCVGVYVSAVLNVQEPGHDFLQMCQNFEKSYAARSSRDFLMESVKRVTELANFLVMERPEEWGIDTKPMLNALGQAERMITEHRTSPHSSVTIGDMLPAIDVLTPENPMYVYTWRRELTLCTCYNDAYYTEQRIHQFMDRIFSVLERELNISVPRESRI